MKVKFSHFGMLALPLMLTGTPLTSNAEEQKSFDVFYYSLSDQYISSFQKDLEAIAKEQNITLETFDANNDAGVQELQIAGTLSNKNPKIINLVQPEITGKIIDYCKKTGSRVVFFNRQPDLKQLDEYAKAWYVESASMQAGQLQAEVVIEYILKHPEIDRNKDGRIATVILTGPQEHQATYLRTASVAVELCLKFNNIDIKSKLDGGFDSLKARGELENYVMNNGIDQVELIISNNDAMALGAISVLNNEGFNTGKKNKKYIPVFSIDGIEPAVKAIKENKLEATLVNDSKEQAAAILLLAQSKETDNRKLGKKLNLKVWENGTVYVPYTKIIRN
jgi:methyl-galactoside transport system substrate-binding protein